MSVLGIGVTVPLPVLSGLLVAPGIGAYILANQFPKLDDYFISRCTFSAVVSAAMAFALVKSALVVAVIALATFSVLQAYESHHRESTRQVPVDQQLILKAIDELSKKSQVSDPSLAAVEEKLSALEGALSKSLPKVENLIVAVGKISEVQRGMIDQLGEVAISQEGTKETLDGMVLTLNETLECCNTLVSHLETTYEEVGRVNETVASMGGKAPTDDLFKETLKNLIVLFEEMKSSLASFKELSTDRSQQVQATLREIVASIGGLKSMSMSFGNISHISRVVSEPGEVSPWGGQPLAAPLQRSLSLGSISQDCASAAASSWGSPERGGFPDPDKTPVAPQPSKRDLAIARALPPMPPMEDLMDLEALAQVIQSGGNSQFQAYEEMNPSQVPLSYLQNTRATWGFVRDKIDPADGAAIMYILEKITRLDINATVVQVPADFQHVSGRGGVFRGLMASEVIGRQDKLSWLIVAAMGGQEALVHYLIGKGASLDFKVQGRTFLHYAAVAGSLNIIKKYAKNPYGDGTHLLAFDATCAESAETLNHLIFHELYGGKSINMPQSLPPTSSPSIARLVPRGVQVNALHLAILRQRQDMVEALVKCEGVLATQETEGMNTKATPALLLLDFISQKKFTKDHWAIQALVGLIRQLREQNISKDRIESTQGRWFKPDGRRSIPYELKWPELLEACLAESQTAIIAALSD